MDLQHKINGPLFLCNQKGEKWPFKPNRSVYFNLEYCINKHIVSNNLHVHFVERDKGIIKLCLAGSKRGNSACPFQTSIYYKSKKSNHYENGIIILSNFNIGAKNGDIKAIKHTFSQIKLQSCRNIRKKKAGNVAEINNSSLQKLQKQCCTYFGLTSQQYMVHYVQYLKKKKYKINK